MALFKARKLMPAIVALVAVFIGIMLVADLAGRRQSILHFFGIRLQRARLQEESASRQDGDWEVTPLGRLRSWYHFEEQHRLLIACDRKHPELWDTENGKRISVLRDCDGGLETSAVSPSGSQFATGDDVRFDSAIDQNDSIRTLRIWETPTGKLVKTIDIDLSNEGLRDSTDWQVSWLDQNTLLLELHSRWNPARSSVATIFALVDVRKARIVKKSERLEIGEQLTYSPDRKRAVASLYYGVYRDGSGGISRGGMGTTYALDLLDMEAFTVLAHLEHAKAGHNKELLPIHNISWSPEGKWFAAAAEDGTVTIWAGQDGLVVSTLAGHTDCVLSVNFSPDGKSLLTASEDCTARLWDVATGKLLHTLAGHTMGLTQAVFDAQGTRVVSGGEDQTARIWDATTGKQLAVFPRHESGVLRVEFAAAGHEISTVSGRGIERTWSIADGTLVEENPPKRRKPQSFGVCFLREEGDETAVWVGPPEQIPPPTAPDGRKTVGIGPLIFDDSPDDLAVPRRVLKGHRGSVNSVGIPPKGMIIASCSADKTVRLWDLNAWDQVTGAGVKVLPHSDAVDCMAYSADGKSLATGDYAGNLRLWDPQTGDCLHTVHVSQNRVAAVALTPDGSAVFIGGADKAVRFWDLKRGEEQLARVGGPAWITAMAVDAAGKTLAFAANLGDARSKDSKKTERSEVSVWDIVERRELCRLHGNIVEVDTMLFTPDGKKLVTAESSDKSARVWDVGSGKLLATFRGQQDAIRSLAVTPDGCMAASGDREGTIKIWEVSAGAEKGSFKGHRSWVTALAFTPDGDTLISGGGDSTVKLWDWKKMLAGLNP